ncbi:MAG: 50S ribosomal protein L4 [Kiritimatiellaeota bacterium]|nr:50S ribosomal protein L4 [Kiritimatiellota bacterium]
MSTIKVFNPAGDAAGEMAFEDSRLVLDKGEQAVKDVVVAIQNGQRAGSASTLTKGEVAGSNKKPWKQKGSGRARVGLRQNPVWRGGGVAHGPKPRDYSVKVNRKVAQLAYTRALSERIAAGDVVVVEKFDFAEPKTKLMTALLKKVGVARSALVVVDQHEENVMLSGRNLPNAAVVRAAEVDVYGLLLFRTIVASRAGFEALTARMKARKTETGEEGA